MSENEKHNSILLNQIPKNLLIKAIKQNNNISYHNYRQHEVTLQNFSKFSRKNSELSEDYLVVSTLCLFTKKKLENPIRCVHCINFESVNIDLMIDHYIMTK